MGRFRATNVLLLSLLLLPGCGSDGAGTSGREGSEPEAMPATKEDEEDIP